MPRYEFSEGNSNKFWEIELQGASFTTTYGKIGADGKSTTKDFDDEAAAEKAYEKAIRSKVKKGYVLVDSKAPDEPTAEAHEEGITGFQRRLQEDPFDIETYLQYAKWLKQQEDPRGELIELQHQRMGDPQNEQLLEAESALLERHKEHFFGPFAELCDRFAESDRTTMVEIHSWFMGFIHSAKLLTTHERDPEFAPPQAVDFCDMMRGFLSHPSSQFLQHLTLGIVYHVDNNYSAVDEVLGEFSLPTLQSLYAGDFHCEETELNWSELSMGAFMASTPNLRSLTYRSGYLSSDPLRLPELREFRTFSGGAGTQILEALLKGDCPKLEHLSLQFGPESDAGVEDVKQLLDCEKFPKLRHLGITNAGFLHEAPEDPEAAMQVPQFFRDLLHSKLLPQLEELDLSYGTMGDESVDFIEQHQEAFAHLRLFLANECYLSDEAAVRLSYLLPWVEAAEQRQNSYDPTDRYASIYE